MERIPYFDLLFDARRRGEPVARLFERYVHWGYWDDPSGSAFTTEDFQAAMDRLDAVVVDGAGLRDGQEVLDAGCGFGGTLASIDRGRSKMRLVGVNIDARQVEAARAAVRPRDGNALRFVEADACALPFPEGSFDRVLAVECIFHFPSRRKFLEEAWRVLRPGGRLALSDFVPVWPGGRGPGFLERRVAEVYGPVSGWPDGDYRAMAGAAGLKIVLDRDITGHTLPTYPFLIHQAPQLASATRILQWLSVLRLLRYRVLAFEKPEA